MMPAAGAGKIQQDSNGRADLTTRHKTIRANERGHNMR